MNRKKRYNLAYLLLKQPKILTITDDYKMLLNFFYSSQLLQKVKFNRKCYSLLNNCKISYDNLNLFYKYFKIPKHAFFPLFLKLKKEYILKKKQVKLEKQKYILEKMNKLPDDIKTHIKYFAKYETSVNVNRNKPLWEKNLYPLTKKKADYYEKLSRTGWIKIFYNFIDIFNIFYNWVDKNYGYKLIALFIFELPIKKFSEEEIKKQYRLLSKKYHPDKGGNAEYFNFLHKAKEILIPRKSN